ncbi:MAG: RNA polymerase sigma-54 factor [Bacteroidetes bacterium]|nr:MAG: RNA polymerase sigma-54 factor [Bacteroidota bacterium]
MKLSLDLRTSLTQTLTPQQIQYLKLLQLPLVQLEQAVRQEIEQNPMLDESTPDEGNIASSPDEYEPGEYADFTPKEIPKGELDSFEENIAEAPAPKVDDQGDPFEFYRLLWQDDSIYMKRRTTYQESDDDEPEYFQLRDTLSLADDLIQQLRLLPLKEEEYILGEQLIGNVDSDGYLRRDLSEIVNDTNDIINSVNLQNEIRYIEEKRNSKSSAKDNPSRAYAVSSEAFALAKNINISEIDENGELIDYSEVEDSDAPQLIRNVTLEQAEKILLQIQKLEPPGFGSRSVQECLIAQAKAIPKPNAAQKLAIEILENAYESFTMKHYPALLRQFAVTEDYLREAIEFIRKLNPKPGGLDTQSSINSIIPDFSIEKDEETGELLINVNDSRIPILKLNKAYELLKKDAHYKAFNKETKEWIRNKYEDAKFLIQAIRQRKSTMVKVMTAIAGLQRDFFEHGPSSLKPLIYKNVADDTGLDISTVCRIVNGKYVQTEYGIYELKFFFSESLPTEDGEDVSTRVIKQVLKDIIDAEPKDKPYSDDKIAKELKKKGYNVARRTVAKYREQLKIPVARLRKEL